MINRQEDLKMYAIYDAKAECYGAPSFAINEADLQRQVINMFKDPQQRLSNKHYNNAEDYTFYEIGNYCFKTGTIEAQDPRSIATCLHLKSIADNARTKEEQTTLEHPIESP